MIQLSSLIQESVDFSKHGKSVDKDQWEKFELSLKYYPDYLEKPSKIENSNLILGQIYRAIDLQPKVDDVFKLEFKYSLQLRYKLISWIVDLNNPKMLVIITDKEVIEYVNEFIVSKMTFEIKKAME